MAALDILSELSVAALDTEGEKPRQYWLVPLGSSPNADVAVLDFSVRSPARCIHSRDFDFCPIKGKTQIHGAVC